MKMKKASSGAWPFFPAIRKGRSRRGRAGATLVELVTVIAVLAILAGIGSVACSGYVRRAARAADLRLIGDVKYALLLAAASPDSGLADGDGVDLYFEAPPGTGSAAVDGALEAAFGPGWREALRLRYDGWPAAAGSENYGISSFAGNEAALLGRMQYLAGSFSSALGRNPALAGDGFTDYLARNGLSAAGPAAMGSAAVLYADCAAGNVDGGARARLAAQYGALRPEDFTRASTGKLKTFVGDLTASFRDTANGPVNQIAACVCLYMLGEALVQYESANGYDGPRTAFYGAGLTGISSAADAAAKAQNAFSAAVRASFADAGSAAVFQRYFTGGQAERDLLACFAVMDALAASSGAILGQAADADRAAGLEREALNGLALGVGSVRITVESVRDGLITAAE